MSRTTIEVTEDVKESLREERLDHETNYNETIARLLGDYNGPMGVQDIINRIDDLEAQLPRKVAEEVQR